MTKPTAERVRELLHYEPESGVFTWRMSAWRRGGLTAGVLQKHSGYWRIYVDGSGYQAHRLAWLWMTGDWPKHEIDHVNGIRDDNRFCNLRDVSRSVNMQNLRKAVSGNRVGLLGGAQERWQIFRPDQVARQQDRATWHFRNP